MTNLRWNLANIACGGASVQLFAPRTSVQEVQARVSARAAAEDTDVETMLAHYMRERILGQAVVTVTSLIFLALTVLGAISNWPSGLLIPVAIVPGMLPLIARVAVPWLSRPAGVDHKA